MFGMLKIIIYQLIGTILIKLMHSDDLIDPSSYFIIMEKLNPKWGDNIDLDVFFGGLAMEPLRKSMEMFELLRSYTLTY